MAFSPEERQTIYQRELRAQLSRMTPNCDGARFSGQQIAAAKGIASKRALEAIDQDSRREWERSVNRAARVWL